MTEPLSEDELAGLKALADAATPGPWDCGRDPYHYDAPEITKADGAFYVGVKMEDAAFIAGFNPQTALRLLSHIDALKAERWEPIETAPKDGTPIIAYCVHTNAKYATNSIQEGWEYPVIAKWIDHNGGGWTWHGMAGTFTHWRPLPAPPSSLLQR